MHQAALHRTSAYVVESAFLRRRWVTFGKYLTGKGASPTNQCWCQKTRVIAVSCCIKISAVHHLVLSQYMRLTDGRTELRQQYSVLNYMQSHGKNDNNNTTNYKVYNVIIGKMSRCYTFHTEGAA